MLNSDRHCCHPTNESRYMIRRDTDNRREVGTFATIDPMQTVSKVFTDTTKGFVAFSVFQDADERSKSVSFDIHSQVKHLLRRVGLGYWEVDTGYSGRSLQKTIFEMVFIVPRNVGASFSGMIQSISDMAFHKRYEDSGADQSAICIQNPDGTAWFLTRYGNRVPAGKHLYCYSLEDFFTKFRNGIRKSYYVPVKPGNRSRLARVVEYENMQKARIAPITGDASEEDDVRCCHVARRTPGCWSDALCMKGEGSLW